MPSRDANPILVQDEILQMMFWMRGEKLVEAPTLEDLNRFLQLRREELEEGVVRLISLGYLERVAGGAAPRFVLTEVGVAQGKRRFRDEFEPVLGHDSHLICDDPDCQCHGGESPESCLFS